MQGFNDLTNILHPGTYVSIQVLGFHIKPFDLTQKVFVISNCVLIVRMCVKLKVQSQLQTNE